MRITLRHGALLPLMMVSFACETDPESSAPSCGRYLELVDGTCRDVEVRDIESVPLDFSRGGYTLQGTLVLPVTEGTYRPPVFVLVHGSGPNDRDSHVSGALGVGYGQKVPTFRLLAEGLARSGAAVYRYDKRTCFRENSEGRCPTSYMSYPGDLDDILIDDYIEDFRAAVQAVAALEEVDGRDITVVGLSQGANFVPLLLVDEPGVVAGVQLAGGSLPIDQLLVEQLRAYADDLEGRSPSRVEDIAFVRGEADRYEEALGKMRVGTFTSSHLDGAPVQHWVNWMERTDQLQEEFLAVDKPILLLHGGFDFNVRVSHFERFQQWAAEAGMTNVSFVLDPDATHTFVQLEDEGRGIGALFSPLALEAIIGWHR